ncbi:transcription termination factor 1, mitochondrial-like [Lithobates pipiens]
MALKVIISTSSNCVSHLRGSRKFRIPTFELGNILWRPFVTQLTHDCKEKTEGENVGASKASKHQASIRKMDTYEDWLQDFLLQKGASTETIESIISRYPRAVIRTSENVRARWEIWKSILQTDLQVLQTLKRSPESFFRSSTLANLQDNISLFSSLGLSSNIVTQLMARAPRTFSNRAELNRNMVELLQNVCTCLGGNNPEEFAKNIIAKNVYLLTRSTKRIKVNIAMFQTMFKIPNVEMLDWIQGNGSGILDLGNDYIKNNFDNIQKKFQCLGCSEDAITKCVFAFPRILYLSPVTLNTKIDLLMKYGIKMDQILEMPRVLDVSSASMERNIKKLMQHGYDFQASGISVLALSRERFKLKIEKLMN